MKTMYLHIGTPKTATTAIQLFCNDNQEVLQSKGYVYPMFPYKYDIIAQVRNAHFLIDGIYGKNYKDRFEQSEINFVEGFKKIYELFDTYDNIILSDEGIWNHSFWRDAHFWKRMEGELKKGLFQLKIVVYLRRQDDFLFSWWNQQIKEGNVMIADVDWSTMLETMPRIKLDYYDMIKKIEEKVGRENIMVRIFEKGDLYGGSIQADFLNAVGLEFNEEYIVKKQLSNPSLNKTDIEIKRLLNAMPNMTLAANAFFRKAITNHSKQYKDDSKISMFSEAEYNEFMNKFLDGNTKLAKEYFNKNQLFDLTYKADAKWDFDVVDTLKSLTMLMGEMMIHVTSENADLKNEIQSIKKEMKGMNKELQELKKCQKMSYRVKKRLAPIKRKLVK